MKFKFFGFTISNEEPETPKASPYPLLKKVGYPNSDYCVCLFVEKNKSILLGRLFSNGIDAEIYSSDHKVDFVNESVYEPLTQKEIGIFLRAFVDFKKKLNADLKIKMKLNQELLELCIKYEYGDRYY